MLHQHTELYFGVILRSGSFSSSGGTGVLESRGQGWPWQQQVTCHTCATRSTKHTFSTGQACIACYAGNMTKQKAGERKRTVTVTIGPLTSAFLDAVAAKLGQGPWSSGLSATDLVGAAVTTIVPVLARDIGVAVPSGLLTHFD